MIHQLVSRTQCLVLLDAIRLNQLLQERKVSLAIVIVDPIDVFSAQSLVVVPGKYDSK
jgi:hypothetical protein